MTFTKRYLPLSLLSVYFLNLVWRGLGEQFNVDDMMNLGVAYFHSYSHLLRGIVLFWSGVIRPLGGLWYLLIYQCAGFWALPFHAVDLVFQLFNLFLLYQLLRKLTGSLELTFMGTLFGCFHFALLDIYLSTGAVYDVLCQTCILAALNLYLSGHGEARRVSPLKLAALALLNIAAVDAKEIGVVLPALLLAYELVFHPPGRSGWKRWASVHLPAIAITGLVSTIFLLSRFAQRTELTGMAAYTPVLTGAQYVLTTRSYLDHLFQGKLSDLASLAVLLLPLPLAALLSSRLMLFGWLYFVIALAPMSFVPPRAGYALYIPMTGLAILFTSAFGEFRRRLAAIAGPWRRAVSALCSLALASGISLYQYRQSATVRRLAARPLYAEDKVNRLIQPIVDRYPALPRNARLLLINDPFPGETWLPRFCLWLRYSDLDLQVDKLEWDKSSGPPQYDHSSYHHAFLYSGDGFWEMRRGGTGDPRNFQGQPFSFVEMGSHDAELSIVKEVGGNDGSSPERWVFQDPQLRFQVPRLPARFEMELTVPEAVSKQTGPMRIQCTIAGKPGPPLFFPKSTDARYEAPLPPGLREGEIALVQFHVENPYVSPRDGAKLGFLLRNAGFVSLN